LRERVHERRLLGLESSAVQERGQKRTAEEFVARKADYKMKPKNNNEMRPETSPIQQLFFNHSQLLHLNLRSGLVTSTYIAEHIIVIHSGSVI
jgi:hypothetical protein